MWIVINNKEEWERYRNQEDEFESVREYHLFINGSSPSKYPALVSSFEGFDNMGNCYRTFFFVYWDDAKRLDPRLFKGN